MQCPTLESQELQSCSSSQLCSRIGEQKANEHERPHLAVALPKSSGNQDIHSFIKNLSVFRVQGLQIFDAREPRTILLLSSYLFYIHVKEEKCQDMTVMHFLSFSSTLITPCHSNYSLKCTLILFSWKLMSKTPHPCPLLRQLNQL